MTGDSPVPAAPRAAAVTLHASAVLIGNRAIVIRGDSGAGKSSLALDLIGAATATGQFARLIGDDRVIAAACHDRLVIRALGGLSGRIELRGRGILTLPHEPAGVAGLVVSLIDAEPVRYPEVSALTTTIAGIAVPQLIMRGFIASRPLLVLAALVGRFDPQEP